MPENLCVHTAQREFDLFITSRLTQCLACICVCDLQFETTFRSLVFLPSASGSSEAHAVVVCVVEFHRKTRVSNLTIDFSNVLPQTVFVWVLVVPNTLSALALALAVVAAALRPVLHAWKGLGGGMCP